MTNAHSHRSDIKQKNKVHKGEKKSHKSRDIISAKPKVKNRILNKREERQRNKQLRQNKLKIVKEFQKNANTNEFLQVAIIPLCETLDPHLAATLLMKTDPNLKNYSLFQERKNTHYVHFDRFKKNVIINIIEYDCLFQTIDLVHASDCVIFLVPSNIDELISVRTNRLLKSLFSIGLPPYMFTVLSNICDNKLLKNYLESLYIVPDEKVWSLNNPADAGKFLRQLCEKNLVRVPPREISKASIGTSLFVRNSGKYRSLMKCDHLTVEKRGNETFACLYGVIRRAPLCLDEGLREYMQTDGPGPFIHLPGYGDFPVANASWIEEPASSAKHEFSLSSDKIQANGKCKDFKEYCWVRNPEWDLEEKETAKIHELEALNADEQDDSFDEEDDELEDSPDENSGEDSEPSSDDNSGDEEMDEDDNVSIHSIDSDQRNKKKKKLGFRQRTEDLLNGNDDEDDDTFSSYSWQSKTAHTMSSSGKSILSQAQLAKFRQSRVESQFPDEVEAPYDISARERFCKYRGLDRFRTSLWPLDQDPPLPMEFAKSFRFNNYLRDRRTMTKFMTQRLKSISQGKQNPLTYVPIGSFCQITIGPIDCEIASSLKQHVHGNKQGHLFLWSLLPHERRFSVVHFSMKRSANAAKTAPHLDSITRQASEMYKNYSENEDLAMELGEEANWAAQKTDEFLNSKIGDGIDKSSPEDLLEAEPIRSKEPMVFQVGIRRFLSCPIYSESLSKVTEKAKFERFFNISLTTPTIASCYAPVVYAPQNVLQFRVRTDEDEDGQLGDPYVGELVATGSVYSVDPQRLIIKRILLSGHPYKINKRSAVVRFMFFNPDDVNFFKPVQLQTKWGAFGHIKQSVGTHGLMKCVFDRQMNSCDVVLMPLYKRVLPKPSYFSTLTNTILSNELFTEEETKDTILDESNILNIKSCLKKKHTDELKSHRHVAILAQEKEAMEIFD